jgi:hypothetical protein
MERAQIFIIFFWHNGWLTILCPSGINDADLLFGLPHHHGSPLLHCAGPIKMGIFTTSIAISGSSRCELFTQRLNVNLQQKGKGKGLNGNGKRK